jgi:hypothetical protein
MQRWLWITGGILALWLSSLLWVHHSAVTSERQAQAQKTEKVVKKNKKVREKVDGQVSALPEAPTTPVATAPDGSAASELLRDWSRPR